MKQTLLILGSLLIVQLAIAQQKTQQFAIKSGYIEYSLSGNTEGTKKLWWDNFGDKTRTEIQSTTTTKIFGIKNIDKTHTIEILVKDKYWTANLSDNTGQKGILPFYQESRKLVENMTKQELENFTNQTITALGGERLGSEIFFGKSCEMIKIMGSKIWIHKGITLKTEAKILEIVNNETAIKFQANKSVSSSKFLPLTNINYENIDQQQQAMFGDMGSIEDAMETMQNGNMEDSENDYPKMIPVRYPYHKFLKKANAFSYEAYKKLMVRSADGSHNAAFMRGASEMLAIGAMSRKNGDISKAGNFENFTHKGKKCMYGKFEEDDDNSMILIVEIPQYDTYITIGSTPPQTRQELIEILNQFEF